MAKPMLLMEKWKFPRAAWGAPVSARTIAAGDDVWRQASELCPVLIAVRSTFSL